MKRLCHALGCSCALTLVVLLTTFVPVLNAQESTARIPRTADGRPNLTGVWQVLNTANWDLEPHSAEEGVPGGLGVVVGGAIPYLPTSTAKRDDNRAKRSTGDPYLKCFLPGVPRVTYAPFPFQIVQSPEYTLFSYEFAHAQRIVATNGAGHVEALEFWMGDSRGHWEGDTLVIDVTDFNDKTWFDNAGNYHSDKLHVIERYTMRDADHITYEATIEDPAIFAKSWTIQMPLYRRLEKDIQIVDYDCVSMFWKKTIGSR